jgi:hypothetical protein
MSGGLYLAVAILLCSSIVGCNARQVRKCGRGAVSIGQALQKYFQQYESYPSSLEDKNFISSYRAQILAIQQEGFVYVPLLLTDSISVFRSYRLTVLTPSNHRTFLVQWNSALSRGEVWMVDDRNSGLGKDPWATFQ